MDVAPAAIVAVPIYVAACAIVITTTAAVERRMSKVADDSADVVVTLNVPAVI